MRFIHNKHAIFTSWNMCRDILISFPAKIDTVIHPREHSNREILNIIFHFVIQECYYKMISYVPEKT